MTRMPIVGLCLSAILAIGAAPPAPDVAPGTFLTWGERASEPLRFSSGGVSIEVAATPCEQPPQNEGCGYDHVSNQATITVTRPGSPPFRMTSDRQADFVRVAAVRLNGDADQAAVVIDNQRGGSAGLTTASVIEPTPAGFRQVPLVRSPHERELEGELSDRTIVRLRDGGTAFILTDPAFDQVFGCNACTPRAPVVLTIRNGRSVDISSDAAARAVFVGDLRLRRRVCVSASDDRNGSCATYVADAARVGQLAMAWRTMLTHYRRGGRSPALWQTCDLPPDAHPNGTCPAPHSSTYRTFPESLRAFLVATGYVTPAQAITLPPS